MNRLMYSLVMAGVLLVCGGCSSECDPVELCSEMDEVILKDGWGVYEVGRDEGG